MNCTFEVVADRLQWSFWCLEVDLAKLVKHAMLSMLAKAQSENTALSSSPSWCQHQPTYIRFLLPASKFSNPGRFWKVGVGRDTGYAVGFWARMCRVKICSWRRGWAESIPVSRKGPFSKAPGSGAYQAVGRVTYWEACLHHSNHTKGWKGWYYFNLNNHPYP